MDAQKVNTKIKEVKLVDISLATYECDIFRHFEIDELLYSLGRRPVLLGCQISWCLRLNFILQRLAHTGVGQFFFFSIPYAIDELQETLESLIFKLSHKHKQERRW